ncbi:MAG TPA: PEGA domain-containing protein [Kofleriaceae bacterium]|jgi:tetratricopeptide (TPR) repeat protein
MKAIAIAIALAASAAYAQPTSQPTGDHEKAGANETLQNGADASRPWANGVKASEQQAALALFHDGNLELNDGLFAKAVDKYQEALSHWDHPAIHYNLALALMNLDKTIEALDNFEQAIKYGESPLQSKDKFDNAKNYIVALGHGIGEIEVTCNKVGAKVAVDGKEVFTAPGTYKGRVKVGRHQIVATLEGHPTRVEATDIQPGAPFKIELHLYTVAELTRYRRKWDAAWTPYVVMGAGVAVGVVGGVFELLASNKYSSYDTQVASCNSGASTMNAGCANSSSLKDLRSTGDEYKTTGFVLYGVGAAAVVTGAVLWWINRPEAYQIRESDLPAPSEPQPAVQFTPVVSPSFAGAALSGRF